MEKSAHRPPPGLNTMPALRTPSEAARAKFLALEASKFTDLDRGMMCALADKGCTFERMTVYWPFKTAAEIAFHYKELKTELEKAGFDPAVGGRLWLKSYGGVHFPGMPRILQAHDGRISTLQENLERKVYYEDYFGTRSGANEIEADKFTQKTGHDGPFYVHDYNSATHSETPAQDKPQEEPGVGHKLKAPLDKAPKKILQNPAHKVDNKLEKIPLTAVNHSKPKSRDNVHEPFEKALGGNTHEPKDPGNPVCDHSVDGGPVNAKIAPKETKEDGKASGQDLHTKGVKAAEKASHDDQKNSKQLIDSASISASELRQKKKWCSAAEIKAKLEESLTRANVREEHYQVLTEEACRKLAKGTGTPRTARQLLTTEAGSFTEYDSAKDVDVSAADMAKRKDRGSASKKHHKNAKKVIIVDDWSSAVSESSSSTDSVMSFDSDEDVCERLEQQKHVYHQVYGTAYPPNVTLKADKYWSEDDCKTLAVIERKYEALKWQHMQAEFYNATGRMVSVELIKGKFEQVKKD